MSVGAASPASSTSSTALTPLRRDLSQITDRPILLKSLLASGRTWDFIEGKASDGVAILRHKQNGALRCRDAVFGVTR